MSSASISAATASASRRGNAGGRLALIVLAWLVFALFLLLPLYVVLSEALKQGSAPSSRRSSSPTRWPR